MSLESPEFTREKIAASAVRFRDEVYTGKTHMDAIIEMEENNPDWHDSNDSVEDGFVTSTGRYVERDEAWEIAKKSGQLDHHEPRKRNMEDEALDAHDIQELRPKHIK
ncbi:MAG: hypothetical protein WDZ93_03475 [Candidatus Paceibacterota bacterium]